MTALDPGKKRAKARDRARQWRKLANRIDAIVFDGDDTLWSTQALYDSAKLRFSQVVSERGVIDKDIVGRLDAIDATRVESLGFSARRFPGSLLALLHEYRKTHELAIDTKLRTRVLQIGRSVFDRRAPTHRGVHKVLGRLKKRFRLVLVTKGSRPVQVRRLRESGLRPHFDAVYIVKDKNEGELRRVLGAQRLQAKRTLFVGDSLRSDIGPALAIGSYAAWIPHASWRYEQSSVPRSRRLYRLESVDELLALT